MCLKLDFPLASAINANEAHFNGPTRLGFRHRVSQASHQTRGVVNGRFHHQRPQRPLTLTSGSTLGGMEASRRTKVQGFDSGLEGGSKTRLQKSQQIVSSVRKECTDCF